MCSIGAFLAPHLASWPPLSLSLSLLSSCWFGWPPFGATSATSAAAAATAAAAAASAADATAAASQVCLFINDPADKRRPAGRPVEPHRAYVAQQVAGSPVAREEADPAIKHRPTSVAQLSLHSLSNGSLDSLGSLGSLGFAHKQQSNFNQSEGQ